MATFKPKTNFIPTDLNFRRGGSKSSPATNGAMYPTFTGRLAEKNFADLINNDDIRNKDASYIIGGRLFGAVVDVNGNGDYKTIQAALDAGETKIFVRSGTYVIKTTITVTSDDVMLVGENKADTILKLDDAVAASTSTMQLGNASTSINNITINNLRFDGNKDNTTTARGIYIFQGTDIQIENCDFVNHDLYGIWGNYTADSTGSSFSRVLIAKNFFKNNNTGIVAMGGSLGSLVFDVWISQNYFSPTGTNSNGIAILGSEKIIVDSNNFDNFYYAITNNSDNNIFSNNIITNSVINGIINDGSYNIITGNKILTTQREGIFLQDSEYNVVSNNIITDSSQETNNTYNAIRLDSNGGNCNHNNISNNIIRETEANKANYGIEEEDVNQDYNIYIGNVIQGAVTANILTRGLNSVIGDNIE